MVGQKHIKRLGWGGSEAVFESPVLAHESGKFREIFAPGGHGDEKASYASNSHFPEIDTERRPMV